MEKNGQNWSSVFKLTNNKVCCEGKIIVGKNIHHLIFSLMLIILPTVGFKILITMILHQTALIPIFIISSLIFFFSLYFMLKSSSMDPGIMEKQKFDYLNIDAYHKTNYSVRLKGHLIQLTNCATCNLIRPPRTSHCSKCDNCVERFDHHCIWIGTCIGKRNIKFFFYFLSFLNLELFFQLIIYILLISLVFDKSYNKDVYGNRNACLGVILALIFYNLSFLIFFLGKLYVKQIILIAKNVTYYEEYKDKYKIVNPFNKTFYSNFKEILFKLVAKSKLFLFDHTSQTTAVIISNKDNNQYDHEIIIKKQLDLDLNEKKLSTDDEYAIQTKV